MSSIPFIEVRLINPNESQVALILATGACGQ